MATATLTGFTQLQAVKLSDGKLKSTSRGSVFSQEEREGFEGERWQVQADNLYENEVEALVTTFRTVGKTRTVSWTPPQGSSGEWLFEEFSTQASSLHDHSVSAVLVRDRQP